MKKWFITGAARGLGLEIARAALEAGDRVIATGRHPDRISHALPGYGDRLHVIPLDVTQDSTESVAADAARLFGGVDVLVNNAGYGQLGAFEEITRESLARRFATNVFGVFDVTQALFAMARSSSRSTRHRPYAHRQARDGNNHLQQGDPVKFAQAILTLVTSSQPPRHFGAGSDAYAIFRKKAAELAETADWWKALTLSTDFAE